MAAAAVTGSGSAGAVEFGSGGSCGGGGSRGGGGGSAASTGAGRVEEVAGNSRSSSSCERFENSLEEAAAGCKNVEKTPGEPLLLESYSSCYLNIVMVVQFPIT